MEISIYDFMNLNSKIIIDIRDRYKYEEGHISESVNIPYDELINNHREYLNQFDNYIIYCQKGKTSKICASILNSFGYRVYSLAGGYDTYISNNTM